MGAQPIADEGPQTTYNIHQAKTHLSELIVRAEAGEKITIARAGKPIAYLIALEPQGPQFGTVDLGGIPDEFFAPLSEEELANWL